MVTHCSPKGISFIIAQEDGDQSYYNKTEEHWDWPGGSSGPTIGVGYDCGYVTKEECTADWTGILDAQTLSEVLRGIGLTGDLAHMFVETNRTSVTVPWPLAVAEFTQREIPKWEDRCRMSLPNFDLLSPDSMSAIVSLAYNRGTGGFQSSLPRYKEMHAIFNYMKAGQFQYIPSEISAMARLWPNVTDLRRRRALEARLFIDGLPECQKLQAPAPATS